MADDFARGDKLIYLRKQKRLTQAAAAFRSGFSEKSIRTWEHDGPIKWVNAKKYAKFYGVDPESIVTRDLRPPIEPEDIEEIKAQLAELTKQRSTAPSADELFQEEAAERTTREQAEPDEEKRKAG